MLEKIKWACLVDSPPLFYRTHQHKEKPTRNPDDKSGIQHSPPPQSLTATALGFRKSIGLKYVSALIGKTITQPLPVFDFLVFLFRKHRKNLRSLHIDISGEETYQGIVMSMIVWMVSTANSISGWIPIHQAMKYSSIIPECLSRTLYNTAPPGSWNTVTAAQFNGATSVQDKRNVFSLGLDLKMCLDAV